MARSVALDYLQNHRYQLLDVSYKLSIPPYVFNPVAGFSSISAPEISLETEEFDEGNFFFKRHLISGGEVSPITLMRGATFYDSEFWLWITAAIQGQQGKVLPPQMVGGRRNLLLIHFTGVNVAEAPGQLGVVADLFTGFQEGVAAYVPAKAWLLMDCLPTRYKVGQDFDATDSEITLMELEISPDRIEEFGVAA